MSDADTFTHPNGYSDCDVCPNSDCDVYPNSDSYGYPNTGCDSYGYPNTDCDSYGYPNTDCDSYGYPNTGCDSYRYRCSDPNANMRTTDRRFRRRPGDIWGWMGAEQQQPASGGRHVVPGKSLGVPVSGLHS